MFITYYLKFAKYLGRRRCFEYYVMQHVLHVNSDVPWPVHISSLVTSWQNIKKADGIDKPTFLGAPQCCRIGAKNGIELGRNIYIANGVSILSSNHQIDDYTKSTQSPPIKIGDNCWIGANAIVLQGVELGEHTVVAAGAVVNKSFPEGNCIVGGVPAQKLKDIGPYVGDMNGFEIKLHPLYIRLFEKTIEKFCFHKKD